MFKI
ncbi:801e23c0-899a-41be-814b-a580b66942f6 [Thermothielavioides terrestris]|jgi:hypothetical protein